MTKENSEESIKKLIRERILILDGAMGTMIQRRKLQEKDFRGTRFQNHPKDLKGFNDLLSLTQPAVIEDIHREYLNAGADIIETNTFNSNRISMADYGLESLVYELNQSSAKLAKKMANEYSKANPLKPRFVAGSIGPTNRTASISPNVNDPGYRSVCFDDLVKIYTEQIEGLIDGGVDLLLVETIFDTLNAKAALFAVRNYLEAKQIEIPVMASVTINDASGRTLSGQTLEAFWNSISHSNLFCIGINCSMGAKEIRPHLEELSRLASCYVMTYPNAGLPNSFGQYEQTPEQMTSYIREFAANGWLNIAGGCCGTTPEHIHNIAEALKNQPPRKVPVIDPILRLSGFEALNIQPGINFVNIGERTNVAGSQEFSKAILGRNFDKALSIARKQVEDGAQIIDINMDEGMLDSEKAMTHFLNLIAGEPEIAKVPFMLDSSKWSVIEAGLKCVQGKVIVNSISLKDGENIFIERARKLKSYGAAVIVMAFDEKGQATTFERKVEICKRSYRILTEKALFPPQDIIFDVNVLTVATGMDEHNAYAVDFFKAVKEIKKTFPLCHTNGGISNVSFSFRGNNTVRQAMHASFLYHAIQAGLDMGIVNAGYLTVYEEVPKDLLERVEDVLLNRRPDSTERLIQFAETIKKTTVVSAQEESWRQWSLEERLSHALIKGITDHLEQDLNEALKKYEKPIQIIEGPLMTGMKAVGDLFGAGKMFLPQVVKTARVMKKAVEHLTPYLEAEKAASAKSSAGKILLATVKGDVHDIGKNIVAVVLGCNNFEVIDLGVMVPAEKILQAAIEHKADVIGLSGLITPSLDEMIHVASEMERRGLKIPLIIGGATTSKNHTAVKISPSYSAPTIYVPDASRCASVVSNLLNQDQKGEFTRQVHLEYENLRRSFKEVTSKPLLPIEEARKHKSKIKYEGNIIRPSFLGIRSFKDYSIESLRLYIDWTMFFHAWQLRGRYPEILSDERVEPEAKRLFEDAQKILDQIIKHHWLTANGVVGIFPANSIGDDIEVYTDESRKKIQTILHTLRQQTDKGSNEFNYALADFIAPKSSGIADYVGAFALTSSGQAESIIEKFKKQHDDYQMILIKSLGDRLAEAFAEKLHEMVRKEIWGYAKDEHLSCEALIREEYRGIRPAPGYPACPDHSEKRTIFNLLQAEKNTSVQLTENFAMIPASSICGLYFAHPDSKYFALGKINKDQVEDYAKRKNVSRTEIEHWIGPNLNYQ